MFSYFLNNCDNLEIENCDVEFLNTAPLMETYAKAARAYLVSCDEGFERACENYAHMYFYGKLGASHLENYEKTKFLLSSSCDALTTSERSLQKEESRTSCQLQLAFEKVEHSLLQSP